MERYISTNKLMNNMVTFVSPKLAQSIIKAVDETPTENVAPIIHCKDCKHWKDSDGVYRRGVDAESKCPINIESVYNGTFYCARAERR